jgi:hypothetical protein
MPHLWVSKLTNTALWLWVVRLHDGERLQEASIDVGFQPFPLSYEAEEAGYTNLGAIFLFVC